MSSQNPFLSELRSLQIQDNSDLTHSTEGEEISANAHIHLPPNFSAFENLAEVFQMAKRENIRALGTSNYYDFTVYEEFFQGAKENQFFPIPGLEIICLDQDLLDRGDRVNDPGNPGKIYICGKGILSFQDSEMNSHALEILTKIRHNDSTRMNEVIERLETVFSSFGLSTGLNSEKVIQTIASRSNRPIESIYLQERHAAQAFQEAFFELVPEPDRLSKIEEVFSNPSKLRDASDTVSFQNEIRIHLIKAGKPAFVKETFIDFEEAMRLILALGCIPVYPILVDGASPICEFEESPEGLIERLKKWGITAVEFIPLRNRLEILTDYVMKIHAEGILVTAGTEHNTLDKIPLVPACLDGDIPSELHRIFWEGTCVHAAHLYLKAGGEEGFVSEGGAPHAGFENAEARIKSFANLGEKVIEAFKENR